MKRRREEEKIEGKKKRKKEAERGRLFNCRDVNEF